MSHNGFAGEQGNGFFNRVAGRPAWKATTISSVPEILELQITANHLLRDRSDIATPTFFLASIDPEDWLPRVVLIGTENIASGIVYAKERRVAGWSTGLTYIDATVDCAVVSSSVSSWEILQIAISHLLSDSKTRGLRLMVPTRHGLDFTSLAASHKVEVYQTEVLNHCVLPLSDDYGAFLQSLGSNTRRNFRYYRRRCEEAGIRFVADMSISEFAGAMSSLQDRCTVGTKTKGMKRAIRMLGAREQPMLAGLRDARGSWLAVVGGWYESDQAVLFCQVNNDVDYPQSSLCTVLRGYLIELLIAMGRKKILFWAGVGYPLLRYCHYLPTTAIYFDRPTFVWRTLRNAFTASSKYFPESVSSNAHWVTPIRFAEKPK